MWCCLSLITFNNLPSFVMRLCVCFVVTSIEGPSLRIRSWKPKDAWSSRGTCKARGSRLCHFPLYTEVHVERCVNQNMLTYGVWYDTCTGWDRTYSPWGPQWGNPGMRITTCLPQLPYDRFSLANVLGLLWAKQQQAFWSIMLYQGNVTGYGIRFLNSKSI